MQLLLISKGRSWMLIGLAFFIAGCGGKDALAPVDVEAQAWEDLRSEVRETIADPTREAEVIGLVDSLAENVKDFREVISKRHQRVRKMNSDYDTTRAEFEVFLEHINAEIQASQQRVSRTHQAFLAATTPEEWSQISKVRTKAMVATIGTIQAI